MVMKRNWWSGVALAAGLAAVAGIGPRGAGAAAVAEMPSSARATDGGYITWREHRIDDRDLSRVPLRGGDGLVMRDLDGDGFADIVSVHEDSSHVRIAFGTPDPDRWVNVTLAEGDLVRGAEDLDVGDVNGDGRPDVIVAGEGGHLVYFEAPANPREPVTWQRTVLSAARNRGSWIRVKLADMNGDGQPDIVAANKGGTAFSYFSRRGAATDPSAWQETVVGNRQKPIFVLPVDLDRDGDMDLLAGSRGERVILLYENLAMGQRWTEHVIHQGEPVSEGFIMELADLNGDGRPDMVTHGAQNGEILWFEQPANPRHTWSPRAIGSISPDKASGIGFADINGDGRPDVIAGGYSASPRLEEPKDPTPQDRSGRIAWFEQPANAYGPWVRHDVSRRRRGMFDVFVPADLNNDGLVDFVTTRGNSGKLDGVIWLEQVRTTTPERVFARARVEDSREMPLPW